MRRPEHQSSKRPRSAEAGFMLVEALVTMAVSAFLLIALASITGLTFRTLDRASAIGDGLESESRVFAALARDVQGARRAKWAGEDAGFVFRGSPSEMIYAEQAEPSAASDMHVVRLTISAGERTSTLTRSTAALLPGTAGAEGLQFSEPDVLMAGNRTIRFAYFGRLEGGEALLDGWSEPGEMPVAIRVALVDASGAPDGPSLRIPLLIDAEPSCAVSGNAACSLEEEVEASPTGEQSEAIDPNDPLGWMRYAQ